MDAQRLCLDIINTLPHTIVENILCLLPIQDAARTSILSREWRYTWTKIPKLEFYFFAIPFITKSEETQRSARYKFLNAIQQVLLLRQGPIQEFSLTINTYHHCFEIDQILLHLSKNHPLKKLELMVWDDDPTYKLPLCALSLYQLTDLYLKGIDLDHKPITSGFGKLRSLSLDYVSISTKYLLRLLSNCPSLTSFSLSHFPNPHLGDISKYCTILELLECLPALEHLSVPTMGSLLEILVLDSVPKELPTLLVQLKYVCFEAIWYLENMFRFLVVLIKCSPNLEKISLKLADLDMGYDSRICTSILEEYSDIWLEHLKEMNFEGCTNMKLGVELVKFILVRSPMLKKVWISGYADSVEEELEIIEILKHAPRASSVKIVGEIFTQGMETKTFISLEN